MKLLNSVVVTNVFMILLILMTGTCWGLNKKQLKEYQKEVSEMNKSLPMMTSKEIQLTRVYLQDSTVVYVLKSVLYDKRHIDPRDLENNKKPASARGLCSAPDSSNMIKQGLIYKYVFYDMYDTYVHEYTVSANRLWFPIVAIT